MVVNNGVIDYDFDRYIRLLDGYGKIREAVLENDKIAQQIVEKKIAEERLELDRKKNYLNDIIDVGKFFAKLGTTVLLTSLTLSNYINILGWLIFVCIVIMAMGFILIIVGLDLRSEAERDYIDSMKSFTVSFDDQLEPLVRHSEALGIEVDLLNEMAKLEQKQLAEKYPEIATILDRQSRTER